MNSVNPQLQLAQHFHATVALDSLSIKKLVELAPLVDSTSTIKPVEQPVKLLTEPVIYRSLDGQSVVINARQVMMAANGTRLHPESRIFVTRLTEDTDLPMARLHFQILEPARLFGDIDDLIHAAYAQNHLTALLNQHVLQRRPDQPITTKQLEQLCGGRVRKSTLNNRKSALGYTNAHRGCMAAQRSHVDIRQACQV